MNYPKKVYLNGAIMPAEAAKVSVFDRGFLFGDGIYEVMVQINGRFFYEEAHLERLKSCLEKIKIDFDTSKLPSEINELLGACGLVGVDCLLYIQVTRGIAPRQHSFPKQIKPSVMMYAMAKQLPDINDVPVKAITLDDFRWSRCDIKMTSLLGNVMLNEMAMQQDCFETLLVRDGLLTEASHCNVFFIKESIVYTHPANHFILDGITRQIVIELCQALQIEVREEAIAMEDLHHCEEAFLTGTSTQIAAIQQIDEHRFFSGSDIGLITAKLQQAFLDLKK